MLENDLIKSIKWLSDNMMNASYDKFYLKVSNNKHISIN